MNITAGLGNNKPKDEYFDTGKGTVYVNKRKLSQQERALGGGVFPTAQSLARVGIKR